jgi:hypothetical protein
MTDEIDEPQLTEEQASQFNKGADAIFHRWTAINLAIEHEMLGETTKEDFESLKENLKKWIVQDGGVIKVPDVQQYTEEVIIEDLGLEIQDGSIAEVSVALMKLYGECAKNDFVGVNRLVEIANKQTKHGVSRSYKQKYQHQRKSSSGKQHEDGEQRSDDKMDETEDDGWTTVHRKK